MMKYYKVFTESVKNQENLIIFVYVHIYINKNIVWFFVGFYKIIAEIEEKNFSK